jgi:hypothetical protein
MTAAPIAVLKRELLVRLLDSWTPYAAHRSRRLTYAQVGSDPDGARTDLPLRVFAEFADLLRGRRMAVLSLGPVADVPLDRVGSAQAELPAEVGVHLLAGTVERLPVALKAAGAAGAPILAFVDAELGEAPAPAVLTALAGAGRPAELLLALGAEARRQWREVSGGDDRAPLLAAGFQLAAAVELVTGTGPAAAGPAELVVYGTDSGNRLDAFKDAMWAVDEFAGVRYRDPGDPDAHPLDISLSPHPGPLRRELLARLDTVGGSSSVVELRRFTLERTVYRTADTTRALAALLAAGQVTREPPHGRLGGDVVIRLAG